LVFISNSSHARQELAFTLTSLNAYSCYDAVYGESGSYFAGNSYYGVRSDYTTSCQAGNTSNASGSVVTATQTLQAATAQTVGVISARISTAKQESAMRKK
jgi:hypothetical protein